MPGPWALNGFYDTEERNALREDGAAYALPRDGLAVTVPLP